MIRNINKHSSSSSSCPCQRCHFLLPPAAAVPELPKSHVLDLKKSENSKDFKAIESESSRINQNGNIGEALACIPIPVIVSQLRPLDLEEEVTKSSSVKSKSTSLEKRSCHSRTDSGIDLENNKPTPAASALVIICDLLNCSSTTSNMSIEEKFQAAVKVIQSLPNDGPYQPSNDTKLKFYGLFKQATEGPCNVPKPAFYDVVGKYKWSAWKQNGSMSKEDAMARYVDGLKEIVETMSFNGDVQDFLDSIGPFYEFVNLQGAEMNHIKDKIDSVTSSSGSNSNVTSGRSSIAPSPVNSCPNSPLKSITGGEVADGRDGSLQQSDDLMMLETETAQVQVETGTATYETSQSQLTSQASTEPDDKSISKHCHSNGDIKANGNGQIMSSHDERNSLTMNDESLYSPSTAQDASSKVAPPPTPQHRRSSKTYQNVLGSVDETTVSTGNGSALYVSENEKFDEEDEVLQRMGPSQNQPGQVTFAAACKEDLEHPSTSSSCNNHVYKNKRGSWIGSRDTLPSTTSGTESEKYYSGDSEPEVDERYAKFFNHQQQGIANGHVGSSSSSAVHIQGSPPPKSSGSKVTSNGSSNSNGSVRSRREKSSPKGSLGGLNQFVNATAPSGDLVLQSTVERLNRDVDHILARLRILEALYATSSNSGIENSRNRKRRFFEGLSNANVAFIVMWPFAVHFLIKLVSWWWRRRRMNRALLKAVVDCGSKMKQ